jgi:hypothetical protein
VIKNWAFSVLGLLSLFIHSSARNAFSKIMFLFFGRFYSFRKITVITPGLLDMTFILRALRNFKEKFRGCVSLVETLHLFISAYTISIQLVEYL